MRCSLHDNEHEHGMIIRTYPHSAAEEGMETDDRPPLPPAAGGRLIRGSVVRCGILFTEEITKLQES